MSFESRLTGLLKIDSPILDHHGELVIAAVQDRAWKIDPDPSKAFYGAAL